MPNPYSVRNGWSANMNTDQERERAQEEINRPSEEDVQKWAADEAKFDYSLKVKIASRKLLLVLLKLELWDYH